MVPLPPQHQNKPLAFLEDEKFDFLRPNWRWLDTYAAHQNTKKAWGLGGWSTGPDGRDEAPPFFGNKTYDNRNVSLNADFFERKDEAELSYWVPNENDKLRARCEREFNRAVVIRVRQIYKETRLLDLPIDQIITSGAGFQMFRRDTEIHMGQALDQVTQWAKGETADNRERYRKIMVDSRIYTAAKWVAKKDKLGPHFLVRIDKLKTMTVGERFLALDRAYDNWEAKIPLRPKNRRNKEAGVDFDNLEYLRQEDRYLNNQSSDEDLELEQLAHYPDGNWENTGPMWQLNYENVVAAGGSVPMKNDRFRKMWSGLTM